MIVTSSPVSEGPNNFYSKFSKAKNWKEYSQEQLDKTDLTPEEMKYDPGSLPKAVNQTSSAFADLMASLNKNTTYDKDYSTELTPEELNALPEATKPKGGVYGYLKQKGQQAYDMIHPALTDLVKKFEGLRTEAYLPTKNDVPTIGYGMTKGVKLGDSITKEQADSMLQDHLTEVQNQVKSMVKVPLSDNQLNAVTSLVYNVGQTAFRHSKALTALNSGDFDRFQKEAFDPEHGFVHQDGEILTGLVNRRQQEKELFNT